MLNSSRTILAIDPGTCKCGVAVVRKGREADPQGEKAFGVLHRGIVPSSELERALAELNARFSVDVVLVGGGTWSHQALRAARQSCGSAVEVVDESLTSVLARKRYFKENPPRGLRRLIPLSLQTPPEAYDDYVALILAERYLSKG